jgi:hypothetical protein
MHTNSFPLRQPPPTHQLPTPHPQLNTPPLKTCFSSTNRPQNGGFEEPNIQDEKNWPKAPWNTYNSKWGWYNQPFPGGWTYNCLRVDWGPPRVLEIQRGAVASPAEGMQNLELLPNATGVACQTVDVTPGQTYKLSFYYGRLQTYAWRNEQQGQFIKFETTMDALARDASKPAPAEVQYAGGSPYPKDGQGFTKLVSADTRQQGSQWQRYEATVTVSG